MSFIRIAERVLQLVPVLLGVSIIAFLMISLTPGDPVEIMLGDQRASPEQVEAMRHDMGLDRPLVERYLVFAGNALRGDFGQSFFHRRPVFTVMMERLPATIELTLAAMLIAVGLAIPLGVLAAVQRGGIADRLATIGSLLGVSLPGFWFGLLLILLFAVHLQILPVAGRMGYGQEVSAITGFALIDSLLAGRLDSFGEAVRHLALPAITLGLPSAAILMRVTRSAMIEVLRTDYILFAEAKGLPRSRIVGRLALKNALLPTVSVAALEIGVMLGGNMVIETVFGWPGLGRLVVESIFARNYPLVQAAVLLYAVTYVMLNFAADILYTVLNPRVRL